MKPASIDALARQHAGEPSPVRPRTGNRHDQPRRPDLTEIERQIAGLAHRSTQIYGLPGASCIAPDRLSGSVAIC
jgi:hypothetical protein